MSTKFAQAFGFLNLHHVLLRRLLFLKDLVLGFLRSFGHEVVLPEDLFRVLKLTRLDADCFLLVLLLKLGVSGLFGLFSQSVGEGAPGCVV